MTISYEKYCELAGIDFVPVEDISPVEKQFDLDDEIFKYRIPILTPDGTCSADTGLEENPYDLRKILKVSNNENEQAKKNQLIKIHNLIEGVQQEVKADWFGVYQSCTNTEGKSVLVKLAYQGTPSRAEFPLTEEFAELSNNTTVGLRGKAVLIPSVKNHAGAYYKCDSAVNSEICLPIYSLHGSEVVGIVDAEAFEEFHFDDRRVSLVAKLCHQLQDLIPLS